MDILQAMTSGAADLMALGDQRGRLEAGLQADIIALRADPLADIVNIRSVHFVMKGGEIVRSDQD
jgi:imidazolonepropionase-like amidohydrolase